MSGQHTQWWLQGEIIAYASSKDGMANRVISVAQFDNALPKNRTEYDVPLGRVDQSKELAAARALLQKEMQAHEENNRFESAERIRSFLEGK